MFLIYKRNDDEKEARFSGNGITTRFVFSHSDGQPKKINMVSLRPGSKDADDILFYVEWTDYLLTVTFQKAPPSGTNNLSFYYRVF
jgi:hypothetical protein